LIAHDWPGNVRELENVVQRSIVLARGDKISSPDLIFDEEKRTSLLDEKPWAVSSSNELEPNHVELADSTGGLQHSVEANEFRIIAETVRKAETKQEAAKLLGISDRTLRYKLAKMRDRGILPKRATG
jgi:two-component system response regulator FlrC